MHPQWDVTVDKHKQIIGINDRESNLKSHLISSYENCKVKLRFVRKVKNIFSMKTKILFPVVTLGNYLLLL